MLRMWQDSKTMKRLERMVDNAVAGKAVEAGFDESKMSALETKLANYLSANQATKVHLAEEKAKIHEMISDISHQTKTPLSNMLLYVQLLMEGDLSQEQKNYGQALEQQTEKLNFLITSLVKMSRLETGMIEVFPQQQEVGKLLESVFRQIKPRAIAKEIRCTMEKTKIKAFFDEKWTAEALDNLLDNSVKYTPQGGWIRLSAKEYPFFCRIDVEDSGLGVMLTEREKVFGRFYRSPRVVGQPGVGLGLPLAREIISAQAGYIKLSSKEEGGSCFSVFLPLGK